MKLEDIIIRDPFVLPYNGKYYLYGTRSFTCWGNTANGTDVYISDDLENWSEPVEVFHKPEGFFANKCYWAPEVHIFNGKFYMFITFAVDGTDVLGTAILRSESPEGPFEPFGEDYITPKDWRSLDGTLYIDDENKPYMVFCHEWIQIEDGEICAVPLKGDLSGADGEPVTLFKASQASWIRRCDSPALPNGGLITDGPFMVKTDDNKLHMFWASFGPKGYVEAMAHSDNNDLFGTWQPDEELLFDKDGGHGMLFKTFEGKYIFVLHTPNVLYHEHPAFFEVEYSNGSFKLK